MEDEIKMVKDGLKQEMREMLPASFYGVKPVTTERPRLVENIFHRSKMYLCAAYHKSISRTFNLDIVYKPEEIKNK